VVTSSFKALQALEAYVVKNGLKQSQQRVDILKIFFEHAGHLSVDQVTQLLHQKNLQIGAAANRRYGRRGIPHHQEDAGADVVRFTWK
jgi:hypothetical protein